jgi:cytochrome bd-type quinol oxidase subunit 2
MSVLWFVVFLTALVGYVLLEGAVIGVGLCCPSWAG